MKRRTITRLALAAGLLSSAITPAFGQDAKLQIVRDQPVLEPAMWERAGSVRTTPSEFTKPVTVAAPASELRVLPASGIAQPPDLIRPVDPGTPGVFETNAGQPPVATPMTPASLPMSAPDAVPNQPPVGMVPCPAPAAATPAATWHGHKYPVQTFAPPGATPIGPTTPGYYTLLAMVRGEEQQKPPRWPYPRSGGYPFSFAETSFTYLDSIPFEDRDWAEKLKRIPVGDHFLFSTGGELRYRYNYETNSRLTGVTDKYNLYRNRTYADLWYEDILRVYGEFYYGDTTMQDLPPYARDVNRGDIQQLFADIKVFQNDNGDPAYVRIGRQELLFGSQRLVSPNDWGNNRAKFQGAKGFYRSEKFDADIFAVQPVPANASRFDSVDNNQWFSGAWFTYKPKKGTFIDVYYMNLDNTNTNMAQGQFKSGAFNVNTIGGRYAGKNDAGFLWELEGAFQFGSWADQSIMAQMFSTYFGYYWKDTFATPTLWVGYDYASGDPDPNKTGQHRTFNQLFAFGHYYLGWVDFVGRQNIHDFTVQGYAYPSHWITSGIQYHVFRLDSNKDALYPGTPSGLSKVAYPGSLPRRDPTGAAGNDVGTEIDVLANFHLTDRQDILMTYSHFFPGTFVQMTGPHVPSDYLYLQYSMRW